MRLHPDVLAAHAQFGGDLESMQKLYSYPDLIDALLKALKSFMQYGCPVCGGDCDSANAPVMSCPVRAGYAAIAKATAPTPEQ